MPRRYEDSSLSIAKLAHRAAHLVFDLRADNLQGGLVLRLKPQDQDVLGIGCAHQTPSVGKEDPRAVDVDDLTSFLEMTLDLLDDFKFLIVVALHPDLRSDYGRRNIRKHLGEALAG